MKKINPNIHKKNNYNKVEKIVYRKNHCVENK